jgi:hypothetical protein
VHTERLVEQDSAVPDALLLNLAENNTVQADLVRGSAMRDAGIIKRTFNTQST